MCRIAEGDGSVRGESEQRDGRSGGGSEHVVIATSSSRVLNAIVEALGTSVVVHNARTEEEALGLAALPRLRCLVLEHSQTFDAGSVCRRARITRVFAPILVLSGEDVFQGLAAGADHVLRTDEVDRICLYVRVLCQRACGAATKVVRCGPIRVDSEHGRATAGGVWLDLTSSERELLELMCRHPGVPISLEELGRELMGRVPSPSDRKALAQRMMRLRQKLGVWGAMIEPMRGAYQLHKTNLPSSAGVHEKLKDDQWPEEQGDDAVVESMPGSFEQRGPLPR